VSVEVAEVVIRTMQGRLAIRPCDIGKLSFTAKNNTILHVIPRSPSTSLRTFGIATRIPYDKAGGLATSWGFLALVLSLPKERSE
jgi:hypothetical protein